MVARVFFTGAGTEYLIAGIFLPARVFFIPARVKLYRRAVKKWFYRRRHNFTGALNGTIGSKLDFTGAGIIIPAHVMVQS